MNINESLLNKLKTIRTLNEATHNNFSFNTYDDDPDDYSFEYANFGENPVQAEVEFEENGNYYTWDKPYSEVLDLTDEMLQIWSAENSITADIVYFIVDINTGYLAAGPFIDFDEVSFKFNALQNNDFDTDTSVEECLNSNSTFDEAYNQDIEADHEQIRTEFGEEVYEALDEYLDEYAYDLGSILYNEYEWDQFANWLKDNKGIKLDYAVMVDPENEVVCNSEGCCQNEDSISTNLVDDPDTIEDMAVFDEGIANTDLKEDLIIQVGPDMQSMPAQPEIIQSEVQSQSDIAECASNVIAAYQNATKWLDIIKEFLYSDLSCVFFSNYIHTLAHTMPERFDKFGDILHTINMLIPYPATAYIPNEPTNIDEAFNSIFMILDDIKLRLNEFIKCTDESNHGMSCATETLLNDIEAEYVPLYRMQKAWTEYNGDAIKFDKWVGQYTKEKDNLIESLNEANLSKSEIADTIRRGYDYIDISKDYPEAIKIFNQVKSSGTDPTKDEAKIVLKAINDIKKSYHLTKDEATKYFVMASKQVNESLNEDTIKQGNSWVNKGKDGTHGKFKTKKEADAQRKAIWANWNKH